MLCSTEDLEEIWKTFLRLLKWYFHRRRVLPDDQPALGVDNLLRVFIKNLFSVFSFILVFGWPCLVCS